LWDLREPQPSQKNEAKKLKSDKNKNLKDYFPDYTHEHIENEGLFEEFTKTPKKELLGHTKAVREMAYSERHKILISCGFDFEIFVWNPYMKSRILKLDGHEHPLVGVQCISQLNCFVTADAHGMVKVWSILDYSCIQTFYVSNVSQVTCLCAVPKHRRLVCGSRTLKIFQYQKPFMQDFTDDNPITCAKFSEKRLEIYVAGERSVNVWDARTGKPVRSMRNLLQSDITCL
jgi:WD40 repeat protein